MAVIDDLVNRISDDDLRKRIQAELIRIGKQRKFGLVFEEHLPECTLLYDVPIKANSKVAFRKGAIKNILRVLKIEGDRALCIDMQDKEKVECLLADLVCVAEFGEPIYPYLKQIDSVCNAPDSDLWHTLIEADNYHALQLLEYLYAGKVDCIYIDPPYNTGAKDWKYNNDYVDSNDNYRHSKWLSMMQKRLKLAKKLLNPQDSVLIVTIDEKEYLHLGCLLEEMFPDGKIQMVSSVINSAGVTRGDEFSRSNEYLFFIKMGKSAPVSLALSEEWRGNTKKEKKSALVWNQLMRSGTGAKRIDRPKMFYPLFVNEEGTKIIKVGDPIDITCDRNSVSPILGSKIIWPIRSNGEEGRWRIGRENLLEIIKKGYVKLGAFTENGMAITYLANGEQKKIENGIFEIIDYREDGSVIEGDSTTDRVFIPGTQWDILSHNATYFGSQLLKKFIGNRFTFPKSLYAVHDAIRFFVANKPNALIVDFFAGSGTTLHAVNLLNAEDGGQRRCIMVTNNEVSNDEAKTLTNQGFHVGDEEWEKFGIARYVNWPRTVCTIEGHNIEGKALEGKYIGSDLPMADGFKANAVYFKLGFLDKTEVALGRQFRELLPLLWLKAGACGECPVLKDGKIPGKLILPKNKFAVLVDEKLFLEFVGEVGEHTEIETVYIVNDSETEYRSMIRRVEGKRTYQLYRDYLDNFRINVGVH